MRWLFVGAVVVLAVAMPAAAPAALFLTFSTTHAKPGTAVTVRTGGKGALANLKAAASPLRVFLAPAGDANAITSPKDDRLVAVGRLRIDKHGDGHLRFIVPDLPPGQYTTFTLCVPCAPSSAGRTLAPTGPFRGLFVVLGPDGFPVMWLVLGAAGAVVASVGTVVGRTRRGRSTH